MKSFKKIMFGHGLLAGVFFFSCAIGYAQIASRIDEQVSPKLKPILSAESKKGWHRFIEGVTLDPAKPEQFFEKYREAFELQVGYGMTLTNQTEEKDLGMNHYRFQQTFNGIPIAGAEYILHQREKQPLKGNGFIISGFARDEKPAISGEAALQFALKQVNAKKYAWEDPEFSLDPTGSALGLTSQSNAVSQPTFLVQPGTNTLLTGPGLFPG